VFTIHVLHKLHLTSTGHTYTVIVGHTGTRPTVLPQCVWFWSSVWWKHLRKI